SMHSYLSRQHQPYHEASYTIFVAEVASTFNEQLLSKVLRDKYTSRRQQMYLINHQLEDIRSTLFRQTMFAEFELRVHTLAEQYTPLTPELLTEEYTQLNKKYFGADVVVDPEGMSEWSRIPHFYYNFYVYQYATGLSAALALYNKVMKEGAPARDGYLSFLSGGSSKYPIDLLKGAGVDMTTPTPVLQAIDTFDSLLDDLEKLALSTEN
ncbi:MAG: oligoendopeptidase F, partial [Chlamydiia bacterium]|nr:oligoendopeptidase F [Chlamydiia bacterium]